MCQHRGAVCPSPGTQLCVPPTRMWLLAGTGAAGKSLRIIQDIRICCFSWVVNERFGLRTWETFSPCRILKVIRNGSSEVHHPDRSSDAVTRR